MSELQRQAKDFSKQHAAVRELAREWERRAMQRADLMAQLTAAHKALQVRGRRPVMCTMSSRMTDVWQLAIDRQPAAAALL